MYAILLSRYPGPDSNFDDMMGGRLKKNFEKQFKGGAAPPSIEGSFKGKGRETPDTEGAGRSRLSAEFKKAMGSK